ncbi:MAG TPA: hypothetical protein VH594_19000 [Trebonia sp.]|jgi:hypothetical protein
MMLRTMMPRTRLEWVEKLAGAGMWIAIGASSYVASTRPEWKWAAAGCVMALAVVSAVAGIPRRLAGRRVVLRKGSGLSGRGRDGDGPAGEAVHRRRTLAVVSRLMPASAGRRWLAEAESLLAEVTAARRGAAVRSYLLSAPRLAVMMWAREVLRRARLGPRRPG